MVFWTGPYLSKTGKRAVLIVAMAAFVPGSATAQAITTAKSLKERCATVQLTAPSAGLACRGYIGAVADILEAGNRIEEYRACPPSNVNREQMVRSVKSWLDRHPDLLLLPAYHAVAEALSNHYPCPDE